MHDSVELWALPSLFFSKIFDQVGGCKWSADGGLFNFEGRELGLEDWRLAPSPPPPSSPLHPPPHPKRNM